MIMRKRNKYVNLFGVLSTSDSEGNAERGMSVFCLIFLANSTTTKQTRIAPDIAQIGDIYPTKLHTLTPDCPKIKRFWGLPNGVSSEPLIAAIFSIASSGKIYFSFFAARKRKIVSGTNMMSDTSFVTNIEVKNTPNTKNSPSPTADFILPARRIIGLKIFSFLNPSSTVSIKKSVPRVRQSISPSRLTLGRTTHTTMRAATTATHTIASRFTVSKKSFAPIFVMIKTILCRL